MSHPESALLNDKGAPIADSSTERDVDSLSNGSRAHQRSNDTHLLEKAATLRRAAGLECNPADELEKLLKKHSGTRQLVLLQDFPDPDALSSAWAYRLIASAYNIQCDIYY
ncbi:MAG: bifunctional oligoribonuclease/PAP phosphatase NrnA, partial [Cyanobacteria bacterium J06632_3]